MAGRGDPAAEDWGAARALAVLAGDSRRLSREIAAEADAAGLAGSRRTGADACVRPNGSAGGGKAVTATATRRTAMTGAPAHLPLTLQAAREG
jgi:hypothetical protein